MAGPEGLVPQHDRLFRGLGDGRFQEITEEVGLLEAAPAYGLGVVVLDADGDGRDLFVANDSNRIPSGHGEDGRLIERAFPLGVGHGADGREQAGMGIACADLDGNGRPSLLVTNFSGEPNALYRPGRRGPSYRERSARLGVAAPSLVRLGWGTGFLDADLDGRLDAFVLNGQSTPRQMHRARTPRPSRRAFTAAPRVAIAWARSLRRPRASAARAWPAISMAMGTRTWWCSRSRAGSACCAMTRRGRGPARLRVPPAARLPGHASAARGTGATRRITTAGFRRAPGGACGSACREGSSPSGTVTWGWHAGPTRPRGPRACPC